MGMKIAVIIFIGLILFLGIGAMIFYHKPMWLFYHHELRTANEIISRVEAFRSSHGKLPETLREIDYEDPHERVFYFKLSDEEYCLSFGTDLGQSETYRSQIRKWEEGRQCVAYNPH